MVEGSSRLSAVGRGGAARAQTLVTNLGRFAEGEAVLEAALGQPGSSRLETRHSLEQLYFWESRLSAMRRLIIDGRREWRNPAAELADLWQIDDATIAIEDVRAAVAAAAALAPDDDRVWLAQAGLDILEGRFDTVRVRLERCTDRRPNDPAVWDAWLRLAKASGDASGVKKAVGHLPADTMLESEVLDLGAWLAARRGDREGEQQILESRTKVGPIDLAAFERLAVLYQESGQPERTASFRRRKTDLDAVKDRYRRILVAGAPVSHFDELATLAEALDRPFEAQGWWELAYRRKPGDAAALAGLARVGKGSVATRPVVTGTLKDRLALLSPAPGAVAPGSERSDRRGPVPPVFRDDAAAAGLGFVFDNGQSPLRQLPETTAGGVGLLDFDGDGWLDVFVVQGGAFPP